MLKIISFLAALLLTISVFAQSPGEMSYQAVIRDNYNNLVTNHQVGMRISILQGSAYGTVVYSEIQSPKTNDNGLISIQIGGDDSFDAIDWSNGPYFLKTETDPNGGKNYTISGTTQLLSVPYAFHAQTAETVTGELNETDPVYINSEAAKITSIDIDNLSNLSGTNTGDQDLSNLATTTTLNDSLSNIRSSIPAVNGFISNETDPVYTNSQAANITSNDINNLSNLSGINTGDQDISGIAANASDISTIQSEQITQDAAIADNTGKDTTGVYHANRDALDLVSGTNTGDQDISGIAANASDISTIQSEQITQDAAINANTGKDTTGVYHANRDALDLVSGTNTGDQDISGIAANASDISTIQSEQITQNTAIAANTGKDTTGVYHANRAALNLVSGTNTGDQDISGIANNASDISTIQSEQITQNTAIAANTGKDTTGVYHANRDALDLVSGTNTGDQDISGIAANASDISTIQSEQITQDAAINANTGKDTTGVYHANRDALDLVSGTNTGDQDISGIAANASDISTIQSEQITQNTAIAANTGKDTTGVYHANRAALNLVSGTNTGDQDISGIANNVSDISTIQSEQITQNTAIAANTGKDTTGVYHANRDALDLVSGTNTGDQDISGIAANTSDISTIQSEQITQDAAINANTGKDTTGVYHANREALDLVSGTNTGDQDISGIANNASDISTIQSEQITQDAAINANTGKDTTGVFHANRAALDLVSGTNTGDQNLASVLSLGNSAGSQIKEVTNPTDAHDAATKAYVDALIIKIGDIQKLRDAGFSVSDLLNGGRSVADLLDNNITISELVDAGASIVDLIHAIDDISDLLAAGISVPDLLKYGVPVNVLLDAGAKASEFIGTMYQGGIIFYVNEADASGLVCAVTDQETASAGWGCTGTLIETTHEEIGTGAQNTANIETKCTTTGTAADICTNLSLNGKTDWFLPSRDELDTIYVHKATIDTAATSNGGTVFSTDSYWSSSQNTADNAWTQNFSNGNQLQEAKDNTTIKVRAVRAITAF